MNELVLANRAADWRRLKMLVLDSVSSPITKRVYNLGLDEFFEWFGREPRPGFTKEPARRDRWSSGGPAEEGYPNRAKIIRFWHIAISQSGGDRFEETAALIPEGMVGRAI